LTVWLIGNISNSNVANKTTTSSWNKDAIVLNERIIELTNFVGAHKKPDDKTFKYRSETIDSIYIKSKTIKSRIKSLNHRQSVLKIELTKVGQLKNSTER
jgi:hypothetical protein